MRVSQPEAIEPARSSSRLIADGDSVARNAFRVGLREDTPIPVTTRSAGVTQELDPSDILEVQDMAAAIARAEMLVQRAHTPVPVPASSRNGLDIFESLGRRPTDDTAGPATPAPLGLLTPVPPAPPASAPEPTALPVARVAPAATPSAPRYLTMPSAPTALEEDAYYHPLGRMRSLADVTLDGYRPEPTLLVRAAARRKRFSWLFVAALLPLLALAAVAGFASTSDSAPIAPIAQAPRTPSVTGPSKLGIATTSAVSKSPTAAPQSAPAAAPVFDVNSLPSAGKR